MPKQNHIQTDVNGEALTISKEIIRKLRRFKGDCFFGTIFMKNLMSFYQKIIILTKILLKNAEI